MRSLKFTASLRMWLLVGVVSMSGVATVSAQTADDSATWFDVYGFAMLDMGTSSIQSHPDWFDTLRPTKMPSFKNEFGKGSNFFGSVRQTRFGVKSGTPTSMGELKTQFEFELFGTGSDAGKTTFRLRHAYAELGQFGAGQTWRKTALPRPAATGARFQSRTPTMSCWRSAPQRPAAETGGRRTGRS